MRFARALAAALGFMKDQAWNEIVAQLTGPDMDSWVGAALRIHAESEYQDVPRLLELLKHENFFVREAAAWPLVELAAPAVLSDLLAAYQRGLDEGHDNDGFTAALVEIPAIHPSAAKVALVSIVQSGEEPAKGHAEWLLEFCE